MKFKTMIAALLVVVAGPVVASPVNLGTLSVPGFALLENSFGSAGTYVDQYNFSIDQSASAGGLVLALDFFSRLDISVTSVSLTGSSGLIGSDATPLLYNFGTLNAGSYTLSIFSTVTRGTDLTDLLPTSVGYSGLLSLGGVRGTQVPEPGTLALFGVGLVGVAYAARRRRASQD